MVLNDANQSLFEQLLEILLELTEDRSKCDDIHRGFRHAKSLSAIKVDAPPVSIPMSTL